MNGDEIPLYRYRLTCIRFVPFAKTEATFSSLESAREAMERDHARHIYDTLEITTELAPYRPHKSGAFLIGKKK